jgi:adenylate kinase family enzyme
MDSGKLVDDPTVLGMIREGWPTGCREGFILDGFPRNRAGRCSRKMLRGTVNPLRRWCC